MQWDLKLGQEVTFAEVFVSAAVWMMCGKKSLGVHIREHRDFSVHYTYYKVQGLAEY